MKRLAVFALATLILAACIPLQADSPTATLPPPHLTVITSVPPTLTPSPTATPTLDQWIYPYTIEGLRQHDYKSGKITIRDELLETDTYTRYLIEYLSDGLTVTGIMQIPKVGKEPFPVIVMNHGFFSRAVYNSGDGTDRAAEFLNRHGYLTLSSDYRSWGDSDIGYSLFYTGLVIDVINLMNAIPSIPQADPERIGMWGHSMGGGVTLKVLTVDPFTQSGATNGSAVEGRIKAAVLYSTVSAEDADIINRWGPGCIGDYLEGERLYGCNSSDILPLDLPPGLILAYKDATRDAELLRQVAALHYLEDVYAPVQINYGTDDVSSMPGNKPSYSPMKAKATRSSVTSGGLLWNAPRIFLMSM